MIKISEETDPANIVSHSGGEYCYSCGKLSADSSLLEEINDEDSAMEPARKFCQICIYRKIAKLCKKEEELAIQIGGYETEIQISKKLEPKFRRYVFDKLAEKKAMMWEYYDAVYSGAEAIGLSTKAAGGYMKKLCSSEGILKIIDKGKKSYVKFKLDKLMLEKQFQNLTGDSN